MISLYTHRIKHQSSNKKKNPSKQSQNIVQFHTDTTHNHSNLEKQSSVSCMGQKLSAESELSVTAYIQVSQLIQDIKMFSSEPSLIPKLKLGRALQTKTCTVNYTQMNWKLWKVEGNTFTLNQSGNAKCCFLLKFCFSASGYGWKEVCPKAALTFKVFNSPPFHHLLDESYPPGSYTNPQH